MRLSGERSLAQLVKAYRANPSSLTPRELILLRKAVKPGRRPLTGYEAEKERQRAIGAARSLSGRNITELPDVVNPARKAAAGASLGFFCRTYFPETFFLPWADDHLRVIAKLERAAREGGLFALAMPRGGGKTSLCEAACLWAILFGLRQFVLIIGSTEPASSETMDSIKMELETNELLLEDFREAVLPIHALDRISQRSKGQLYRGAHTYIDWTDLQVVMPTMPDSLASGAIIRVASITGRIRGMKYKRSDGRAARPDLVLIDDPQTDDSADSIKETGDRLKIVVGAILKLAGPGRKIAAVMPCTVIAHDDLSDKVLNRDKFPDWQGERMKMLYALPREEKLWAEYDEIRRAELRADRDIAKATAFYKARMASCGLPMNRARRCVKCRRKRCMDAGAIVAWPENFDPDEISGLQHAMNMKFQNEDSFLAECQGEPRQAVTDDTHIKADDIAAKVNGHDRGVMPLDASRLTAFVDVMDKALFWIVTGWRDDFTGYVVDYGTFPDQERAHFTSREIQRTLARVFPTAGLEGRIYGGLEKLTEKLLGGEWRRDDGAMMRVERCLVDANWGDSTDVVYQFCRQSSFAALLLPSHGKYVGASGQAFSDYRKRKGERVGHHWRIPNIQGRRAVRHVVYDTNYWKSFIHARLAIAMGDPGCLSLFGKKPAVHRMFSEHLTAEYRVATSAKNRIVDEWKEKPNHPDNHWFDGVVGCAVAASIQGVVTHGHEHSGRRRKKVSFARRYQKS